MLAKVSFLALLALKAYECRLEPLPDEFSARFSLTSCIVSCCLRFFTEEEMITVSLTSKETSTDQPSATVTDRVLLPQLEQVGRWSLLIKTASSSSSKFFKQASNYVIQIRTKDELKNHINSLKEYASWNPYSKFLVFSSAVFNNSNEVVAGIAQTLWSAKIVNGIVILRDPSAEMYYNVYSWFPYSGGKCGNDFQSIQVLDNCAFGYYEQRTDLFPDKIPKQLNNCPVRIRVVQWPPYIMPPKQHIAGTDLYEFDDGLEINLLNTIADVANFKIIYSMSNTTQNFGTVSRNGSTTGIFAALKGGEADIAASALALSEERAEKFDLSTSYRTESLTWCVPHAKSQLSIEKLTNTLTIDAWLMLVVVYLCTSVLVWALSQMEEAELKVYKSLPNVFQNMLSIVLGMAVKTIPRTPMVRCFLFLWIFNSLVMDIYYTTFMISTLTDSSYVGQINTLEEILGRKLKLYLTPNIVQYFNGTAWQMKRILKDWNNCSHINECLSRVAFQRDAAVCIPRLYLEYVNNRYVDENKQPLLYYFKESVVSYPITMYMTKGYPLKQRINELVERIVSAGFIEAWEQKVFDYKWKNASVQAEKSTEEPEQKWLTISHLEAVLLSLAVGHAFAVLVFIAEIIVFKHKRNIIEFRN